MPKKTLKDNRLLVYGLQDPITGFLRYVGKSSSGLKRPAQHLRDYKYPRYAKRYVYKWIKSLIDKGFKPDIVILDECDSQDSLNESEIFYISYLKAIGCPLTNAKPGGEGSVGHGATNCQTDSYKEACRLRGIALGRPIKDHLGNIYTSVKAAARVLNVSASHISDHLAGRKSQVQGYVFTDTRTGITGHLNGVLFKDRKPHKQSSETVAKRKATIALKGHHKCHLGKKKSEEYVEMRRSIAKGKPVIDDFRQCLPNNTRSF